MDLSKLTDFPYYSRFFSNLSRLTIENLKKRLKYKFLKPGEYLYKKGETNPCFYIILSGGIEISYLDSEEESNGHIIPFRKYKVN